jgi:polar amino acid transport system substrate-binding protein
MPPAPYLQIFKSRFRFRFAGIHRSSLKKCGNCLCVLLLSLVFIAPVAPLSTAATQNALCSEPLRVRVSGDYFPFSHRAPGGKLIGTDVELVRTVFDLIDCPIELEIMPFKRAIVELSQGNIDMVPFASITEHRSKFAHYSAPYRNELARLIFRKGEAETHPISEINDIIDHQLIVGHERASYRGMLFDNFMRSDAGQHHVFHTTTTTEGIRMLETGRIDVLVEMPSAVMGVANRMGLEGAFEVHPFPVWEEPVHFMFSQQTVPVQLVDAVSAAIREVRRTEDYKVAFGHLALPVPDTGDPSAPLMD